MVETRAFQTLASAGFDQFGAHAEVPRFRQYLCGDMFGCQQAGPTSGHGVVVRTSRASLQRLLDENDTGLTLGALSRGAQALGYRIKVELVPN